MATAQLLSIAEQRVLIIVTQFIETHGYAPTTRELAGLMSYASNSTPHEHLGALRDKGYVTWIDGKARTLRILNKEARAKVKEKNGKETSRTPNM